MQGFLLAVVEETEKNKYRKTSKATPMLQSVTFAVNKERILNIMTII